MTAAILLSRQPLRPTARTGWVRQVRSAAGWLKDNGIGLCSSTGMQTWDMVTALASMEKIPVKIVLPPDESETADEAARICVREYDLDGRAVEFVTCDKSSAPLDRRTSLMERDRKVVETADILLPISVSEHGGMSKLIYEMESSGEKKVDRRFQISYEKRSERLAYDLDPETLQPKLERTAGRYLIHWTRACNGAWPDERLIDFHRAVLSSERYPRSALDTLCHILDEQRVLASSRHMPGGVRTVSFSSLSPRELIPLIRWRARYRQMSFEPYGIGISKEYALSIGILPVSYYSRAEGEGSDGGHDLSYRDQWLSQSVGQITDWRQEREYRYLGDLGLAAIPTEHLQAFCLTADEARLIKQRTGIRAISFLPSEP